MLAKGSVWIVTDCDPSSSCLSSTCWTDYLWSLTGRNPNLLSLYLCFNELTTRTSPHSMARWGMNAYLYAPKDDDKHRASWRDLYSLEEADQLSQLIREARNRGVSFIYAIAPGLDITFSSSRDVGFLKRKLDQVGGWVFLCG